MEAAGIEPPALFSKQTVSRKLLELQQNTPPTIATEAAVSPVFGGSGSSLVVTFGYSGDPEWYEENRGQGTAFDAEGVDDSKLGADRGWMVG